MLRIAARVAPMVGQTTLQVTSASSDGVKQGGLAAGVSGIHISLGFQKSGEQVRVRFVRRHDDQQWNTVGVAFVRVCPVRQEQLHNLHIPTIDSPV